MVTGHDQMRDAKDVDGMVEGWDRTDAVYSAIESARIEGIVIRGTSKAIVEDFTFGRITAEEMVARALTRPDTDD